MAKGMSEAEKLKLTVENLKDRVWRQEEALGVLLRRLGYSPHNAFDHFSLVPLAHDPHASAYPDDPGQPVLDGVAGERDKTK